MIWPFFRGRENLATSPWLGHSLLPGVSPDGGIRPLYQNVIHCKRNVHQMVKRFRILKNAPIYPSTITLSRCRNPVCPLSGSGM
jgi:hypothetical protein